MKKIKTCSFVFLFVHMYLFFSPGAHADLDDPETLADILGMKNESDRKKNTAEQPPLETQNNSQKDISREPVRNPAFIPSPSVSSKSIEQDQESIEWEAKVLVLDNKNRTVLLKDNVIVTKGPMRFESDEATIYFDEFDQVKTMDAKGNVKFRRDNWKSSEIINALGDEALFDNQEQKVVLKGNAKENRSAIISRGESLIHSDNKVSGREVTYLIEEGSFYADQAEGRMRPQMKEERPRND